MSRDTARIAAQNALVALLAHWGGYQFTALVHGAAPAIGGLWALISGIVVLQATQRDTWTSAWLRVLGTLIGALISATYLTLLPYSLFGLAASIGATVLLCHGARIPDHARLASITVAVVMVVSSLEPGLPPFFNAALRFVESFIGTTLAVLVVLLTTPKPPAPPS